LLQYGECQELQVMASRCGSLRDAWVTSIVPRYWVVSWEKAYIAWTMGGDGRVKR